jgi:hypothetical protein
MPPTGSAFASTTRAYDPICCAGATERPTTSGLNTGLWGRNERTQTTRWCGRWNDAVTHDPSAVYERWRARTSGDASARFATSRAIIRLPITAVAHWNDAETWHLRSTHKAPTALTARCGGAPARGDTAQSICGASCDASESPARANLAKPCARHGTVRLVDAALSPGEQPVETTARRMVDQTPQCRKMAARTASSSKGLRRHSKIPSRIAVC